MKIILLFLFFILYASDVLAQQIKTGGFNNFAVDSFKKISSMAGNKTANMAYSPYSVSLALMMTASGADQKTFEEMKKVLYLDSDYLTNAQNLIAAFEPTKDYQMITVNRLWVKKAQTYFPQFTSNLKENFQADFVQLDFANYPKPSRLTINVWVEEATKGKIKELLPEGSIRKETDLVITNAIYFKGLWGEPFDKKNTKNEAFQISKTRKKTVPFMNARNRSYSYYKDTNAQILDIPYQNDAISFLIALPNENTTLDAFTKSLSPQKIQLWRDQRSWETVHLSWPKFTVESPIPLGQILKSMGIVEAFNPLKANFSKIRPLQAGENLSISNVIHKAFVEVNEEGTEAAAATAVGVFGSKSVPPPPIVFKVNRPFLYFIRHNSTGLILFMGRVIQP